jgi:hypothetical protein
MSSSIRLSCPSHYNLFDLIFLTILDEKTDRVPTRDNSLVLSIDFSKFLKSKFSYLRNWLQTVELKRRLCPYVTWPLGSFLHSFTQKAKPLVEALQHRYIRHNLQWRSPCAVYYVHRGHHCSARSLFSHTIYVKANIIFVAKYVQEPRKWTDSLARPKHRKRDTRFGTWNVRSLYRTGLLKTVAKELGNYKERDHLKDQGVDGRMGSEWILGRLAGGV